MFEHSVRVPRHYKVAANIFKKVSTEGGSVKTLLYDNKLRHFRTNVLFALITETVKHAADIDKIFETSEILKKESRLDPWLAKVLTAELLFGKKSLPGISKPEQTILGYKEQFEKYTNEHEAELKTEVVHRPRYVRINTNLLTTSEAIRSFQDEGYRFIRCTSSSYNDYLKQIEGLTEYDFTQDYHVKTVFVFPPGTKLHEHELYLENKIILQDKATTLAVHLLAPPPGSVVLDMCAAPGMKTTQVAAYMRNEGKVYAVERNEKRFQTLTDFVNKTGCKCVELIHRDALEIRRGDYDDVEYILLDPSCSGSGMEFSVHNYIEDTRLAKLTSLQEKFLKHAMNAFPKAKRIVYSTCSMFPEENERVITNVVKNSRAKWRVQDVKELLKGQWNNIGSGMYGSMGTRCLYAKPDSDYTTGFFLAVLDRDSAEVEKVDGKEASEDKSTDRNSSKNRKNKSIDNNPFLKENELNESKKDKKKKNCDVQEKHLEISEYGNECTEGKNRKKNKKCKLVENEAELEVSVNEPIEAVTKEKKKKRKCDDDTEPIVIEDEEEMFTNNEDKTTQEDSHLVKKKKKKRKQNEGIENQSTNYISEEIENVDQPKKKKKKDRVKEFFCNEGIKETSADDFPVEETRNDETNKKLKKKKKKCD